jgi:glycosyltransferase involved in cell wall biosynthesis
MTRTVAVVTNIPRPYRRALFATVKHQLGAEGLELCVLYTSDPAKHVRRGSPAAAPADAAVESFIPGFDIRISYDRVLAIPLGLGRALASLAPACVVSGGFGPSALTAARWCRAAKVPYVLWSGAWPGQEGKVGWSASMVRKRLVKNAAAHIAYGSAAADYLVSLGAQRDRVFCAWNTVDLEGFAAAAREAAARRSELSLKYRLAAKNLLFVGSLVERKGLRELVSAALITSSAHADWALHLVGGGPLTDELQAAVRAAGKEDHFRFHGLRPESDVAELLGVADGFLLPTKQEAWGLVINEAMACGIPVVASPQAGATRDLIEDGATGFVVEPRDTLALAVAISRLLSDDPLVKNVGLAGAESVRAKASLDETGRNFVAAVRCAMGKPVRD